MTRILKHEAARTAADWNIELLGFLECLDEWCEAWMHFFEYKKWQRRERERSQRYRADPDFRVRELARKLRDSSKPRAKGLKAIRGRRRRLGLAMAATWGDKDKIAEIYALRDSMPGPDEWHVDHHIPLVGRHHKTLEHIVCGLHVETNLRVITKQENLSKGCSFNPDEHEELWTSHSTSSNK